MDKVIKAYAYFCSYILNGYNYSGKYIYSSVGTVADKDSVIVLKKLYRDMYNDAKRNKDKHKFIQNLIDNIYISHSNRIFNSYKINKGKLIFNVKTLLNYLKRLDRNDYDYKKAIKMLTNIVKYDYKSGNKINIICNEISNRVGDSCKGTFEIVNKLWNKNINSLYTYSFDNGYMLQFSKIKDRIILNIYNNHRELLNQIEVCKDTNKKNIVDFVDRIFEEINYTFS